MAEPGVKGRCWGLQRAGPSLVALVALLCDSGE